MNRHTLTPGKKIYKQMKIAYTAGSDYIVIFNYPTPKR